MKKSLNAQVSTWKSHPASEETEEFYCGTSVSFTKGLQKHSPLSFFYWMSDMQGSIPGSGKRGLKYLSVLQKGKRKRQSNSISRERVPYLSTDRARPPASYLAFPTNWGKANSNSQTSIRQLRGKAEAVKRGWKGDWTCALLRVRGIL